MLGDAVAAQVELTGVLCNAVAAKVGGLNYWGMQLLHRLNQPVCWALQLLHRWRWLAYWAMWLHWVGIQVGQQNAFEKHLVHYVGVRVIAGSAGIHKCMLTGRSHGDRKIAW